MDQYLFHNRVQTVIKFCDFILARFYIWFLVKAWFYVAGCSWKPTTSYLLMSYMALEIYYLWPCWFWHYVHTISGYSRKLYGRVNSFRDTLFLDDGFHVQFLNYFIKNEAKARFPMSKMFDGCSVKTRKQNLIRTLKQVELKSQLSFTIISIYSSLKY